MPGYLETASTSTSTISSISSTSTTTSSQTITSAKSTAEYSDGFCTDDNCLEYEVNYPGNDIIKEWKSSAEECSCLCQAQSDCQIWVWASGGKMLTFLLKK